MQSKPVLAVVLLLAMTVEVYSQAPPTPTISSIAFTNPDQLVITWNSVDNSASYIVSIVPLFSSPMQNPFTVSTPIAVANTTFTVVEYTLGNYGANNPQVYFASTYNFSVKAQVGNSFSAFSTPQTFSIPQGLPGIPLLLNATYFSANGAVPAYVLTRWRGPATQGTARITSYLIQFSTAPDFSYNTDQVTAICPESCPSSNKYLPIPSVAGLTYVRIAAVNAIGQGLFNSSLSLTLLSLAPPPNSLSYSSADPLVGFSFYSPNQNLSVAPLQLFDIQLYPTHPTPSAGTVNTNVTPTAYPYTYNTFTTTLDSTAAYLNYTLSISSINERGASAPALYTFMYPGTPICKNAPIVTLQSSDSTGSTYLNIVYDNRYVGFDSFTYLTIEANTTYRGQAIVYSFGTSDVPDPYQVDYSLINPRESLYQFQYILTNGFGNCTASPLSSPLFIPGLPVVPPITFSQIVDAFGQGTANVSWATNNYSLDATGSVLPGTFTLQIQWTTDQSELSGPLNIGTYNLGPAGSLNPVIPLQTLITTLRPYDVADPRFYEQSDGNARLYSFRLRTVREGWVNYGAFYNTGNQYLGVPAAAPTFSFSDGFDGSVSTVFITIAAGLTGGYSIRNYTIGYITASSYSDIIALTQPWNYASETLKFFLNEPFVNIPGLQSGTWVAARAFVTTDLGHGHTGYSTPFLTARSPTAPLGLTIKLYPLGPATTRTNSFPTNYIVYWSPPLQVYNAPISKYHIVVNDTSEGPDYTIITTAVSGTTQWYIIDTSVYSLSSIFVVSIAADNGASRGTTAAVATYVPPDGGSGYYYCTVTSQPTLPASFIPGNTYDYGYDYSCYCQNGWSGQYCDVQAAPCNSNPCLAGGSCNDQFDGEFLCDCVNGLTGLTCNTNLTQYTCNPSPCLHGPCTLVKGVPTCSPCDDGWQGTLCDTDIDECSNYGDSNGYCDSMTYCHNTVPGRTCTNCPSFAYTTEQPIADISYLQQQVCRWLSFDCSILRDLSRFELQSSVNGEVSEVGSLTCRASLDSIPSSWVLVAVYAPSALVQVQTSSSKTISNYFSTYPALQTAYNQALAAGISANSLLLYIPGYGIQQSFTLNGVRNDAQPGDTDFCITASSVVQGLSYVGADPNGAAVEYAGVLSPCYTLTWVKSSYPTIYSLTPTVIPTTGNVLVTIVGINFDSDIQVSIQGEQVYVVSLGTVDNPPIFVNDMSNQVLVFVAPPIGDSAAILGYNQLTLYNPDSNEITQCPPYCPPDSELYYSSDCAKPGIYGKGSDCHPCPNGAVCPGGYRLWPEPGNWINGEGNVLTLASCQPPATERCPGGPQSLCGTGYTGAYCAECDSGYYEDSGVCRSCASAASVSQLVPMVLFASVFFGGVGLAVILVSDNYLNLLAVLLVMLQQAVAVGRNVAGSLPSYIRYVYLYMKLVLFDYNFVPPGCTVGFVSFSDLYFGTMIFMVVVAGYFVLCALVHQFVFRKSKTERWIMNPSKPRVVRALIFAVHVTYLQICIRTFDVLNCENTQVTDTSTAYRLAIERSTTCYTGTHAGAAALAWFVLTIFIVGLPCYWLYSLWMGSRKNRLDDKPFRKRWGFLYRAIKTKFYWFRLLDYFFSLLVALGLVFLNQSVAEQMWSSFVIFGAQVALITLLCPYITHSRNDLNMFFTDARLAAVTVIAFFSSEYVAGGVICALSAMLIVASFGLTHTIWRNRLTGSYEDTRRDTVEGLPQDEADVVAREDEQESRDSVYHDGARSLPSNVGLLDVVPSTPSLVQMGERAPQK